MAKFKFKLESLLRLREVEEDRARRKLHELMRARQTLENQLSEILSEREGAKAEALRERRETTDVDMRDVLHRQRYLNVLYLRALAKREEITSSHAAFEQARVELQEARRRLKVVEQLRERRRADFDLEQARIEQRELDEIGQVYNQSGEVEAFEK